MHPIQSCQEGAWATLREPRRRRRKARRQRLHTAARALVKMLFSPAVLSAAVLPLTNFTCRRRDMLLTPDEAALALRGSIAPSLRQRSSSYYWHAVSRDEQAKHEAICTKRAGWHLRTFGSHANWALAAEEKCGAKVGVARLVRRGELDSCAARRLEDLPASWRERAGVNNHTRGGGWWRWKPYYLLRELRAVRQGDVMVHTDYDLQLTSQPAALWCLGQNAAQGVATFHFPCLTDRAWTKAEVASALGRC